MKVDIDKYLAENEVQDEASPEVDIDAYLAANEPERMPVDPILGAARKAGFSDNFGIDALEAIATAADYTAAPIRGAAVGAIKSLKDQYYDKSVNPLPALYSSAKGFAEPLVKGPGYAPTGKEWAQEMAIPEEYADEAGVALDMLSGFAGPKALNLGARGITKGLEYAGKGVAKLPIIDTAESAAKVVGLGKKSRKEFINAGEESVNREALEYANKNLISGNPLKSSAHQFFKRTQKKAKEIGGKIGDLRKEAKEDIEKILLSSKTDPNDVSAYLQNGFGTPKSIDRMKAMVDETVEDAMTARQMKSFIENAAVEQMERYKGSIPDFQQLSRLKSSWQDQITDYNNIPDLPWKKKAYNILRKEANIAMDNELDFLDRINAYTGSRKAKHDALKREFKMLKTIEEPALSKAADAMDGKIQTGDSLIYNIPVVGPYLKVSKNRLIDPNLARLGQERVAPQISPLMQNILGGAQALPAAARPFYERPPLIDGYSNEETRLVDPNTGAMILQELENDPSVSIVEKAKIISNYNKTGRVPI
jgi:hypothetical protein